MNGSLGDALTIVLERNHVEYTVSKELLDDLTECFLENVTVLFYRSAQ